jgi:predicted lipoprotein with Yx(FWY)xxD motif
LALTATTRGPVDARVGVHHFPPNSTRRTTCRQGTIPPLRRALGSSRPPRRSPPSPRSLFLLLRPGAGNAAQSSGAIVSTAKTSLGRILVNSSGRTLYLFGKDKNGKSSCSGMCASFWPPLITTGKPRAGTGTKASLLGTTKRADGRVQVTYNHHPLYTFKKDTKKGQTNGEGLSAFGATWYAVSPAGARVVKSSGGGGGY